MMFGIVAAIRLLWPDGYDLLDYIALAIIGVNLWLRLSSPRPVVRGIALLVQCLITLFWIFFPVGSGCSDGIDPRVPFLFPLIPLAQRLGIHQETVEPIYMAVFFAVMVLEPIVVGFHLYDWYRSRYVYLDDTETDLSFADDDTT